MRRVASLLFLPFAAAAATVRGPADVESLTAAAQSVVHARVVSQESGWGARGASSGLVFTRVTLQPVEWWKGGHAQRPFVVRLPGGSVDGVSQTVQGEASFSPREEVVLFLRKLGDEPDGTAVYEVHALALGKFTVGGLPQGALHAVRDRSQVACVGCRANEEDHLLLGELRDRVRRAAGNRP